MLAETLGLDHVIVHRPEEVPWHALPPRAILQLHWLPEPGFTAQLAEHGFRVISNCRHPLDVLMSVLAFSQHDNSTLRWLGGADQDERAIHRASPLDEAFWQYAVGPRARSLLAVSVQWWNRPGVLQVRYEQLLAHPGAELDRLLKELEVSPRRPTSESRGQFESRSDARAKCSHAVSRLAGAGGTVEALPHRRSGPADCGGS